ncbi:MAG: hypothetical protein ACJ72J_07665 [Nitrososphaeraceae archaeon]
MLSKSSAWESKMSVRRQQAELIALAKGSMRIYMTEIGEWFL